MNEGAPARGSGQVQQCSHFGPLLARPLPARLQITVEYQQLPRAEHRPHTSRPPSPCSPTPQSPVTFLFGRGGAQRGHPTYPGSHSQGGAEIRSEPTQRDKAGPLPHVAASDIHANTYRVCAASSIILRALPVSSQFFILYTTLQGGCYSTPFNR